MRKGRKKTKKVILPEKNIILCILIILLVILVFLFGFYIFKTIKSKNSDGFVVESRTENIKNSPDKSNLTIKTVGWLRIQGTNIDYPVYFSLSYNFQYLADEDFTWTYGDFDSLNNIVYISGHNIKNLSQHPLIADEKHSRFEQLMSFTYYDFAKENQFIQYTFNGKDYVYRIFSVSYVPAVDIDSYNNISYSKENLKLYIDDVSDASMFKYDVDVNENDKLISLDTCTRMMGNHSTYHFRVVGRLLREDESITNATVTEKSNYEEIKTKLEGGDSYDEA